MPPNHPSPTPLHPHSIPASHSEKWKASTVLSLSIKDYINSNSKQVATMATAWTPAPACRGELRGGSIGFSLTTHSTTPIHEPECIIYALTNVLICIYINRHTYFQCKLNHILFTFNLFGQFLFIIIFWHSVNYNKNCSDFNNTIFYRHWKLINHF